MKKIIFVSSLFFSVAQAYIIPETGQRLQTIMNKAQGTTLKEPFTLVAWNVHKGKDKLSWQKDLFQITQGADIVLLQEAMRDSFMDETFTQWPAPFHIQMAVSFFYEDGRSTGVATAASAVPTFARAIQSRGREVVVNTPKMNLLQKFRLESGLDLLVINIHGMNVTRDIDFFQQIQDILPEIDRHQGPIIWAGDFNTRNKSRLKFMNNVLVQSRGFHWLPSPADRRRKMLDHIFSRGCGQPTMEILNSIETSDHKPVRASFRCDGAR